MTSHALPLCAPEPVQASAPTDGVPGFGELRSPTGGLPLTGLTVEIDVVGIESVLRMEQRFTNPTASALEVTYIFPLPGRAAVTGFVATLGGRRIVARLREREVARDLYDAAIAEGRRASILEGERPEVFTIRVGNIGPHEEASVELTLVQRLPVDDGQATIRFPLVVAPRYVPGRPLEGPPVGDGIALDTTAAPDASRVTPPVLLAGCPDLADLAITLSLDPAGLCCSELRSTLHAVTDHHQGADGILLGPVTIHLAQSEAIDRDFIVRYRVASPERPSAVIAADGVDAGERTGLPGTSTVLVTLVPPAGAAPVDAVDLVVVLDRSGSMGGWKMVTARRAAGRIVDSLGPADRFALLAFDTAIDWFEPTGHRHAERTIHQQAAGGGLVVATDAARYRATEWLAGIDARGGTDLDGALHAAFGLTAGSGRPRGSGRHAVVLVVTDGHVADEDRLVHAVSAAAGRVRLHGVGIDQAVNAGLLDRISRAGRGHWDLVESEDRLDEVLAAARRRIREPVLRDVRLDGPDAGAGTVVVPGSETPGGPLDAFAGTPLTIVARASGSGPLVVRATGPAGEALHWTLEPSVVGGLGLIAMWGAAGSATSRTSTPLPPPVLARRTSSPYPSRPGFSPGTPPLSPSTGRGKP